MTAIPMHPFEERGLGKGPFKFVGFEVRRGPIDLGNGFSVGAPGQPMGTCDYCGTGIADCYSIQSADDKRFIVGCDCVRKLAKSNNAKSDPAVAAIMRKANAVKAQRVRDAQDAKIQPLVEFLNANHDTLTQIPHGLKSMAERSYTAWDEFQWYSVNAGRKGKLDRFPTLKAKVLAKLQNGVANAIGQ